MKRKKMWCTFKKRKEKVLELKGKEKLAKEKGFI
jgi:hypothetical protein